MQRSIVDPGLQIRDSWVNAVLVAENQNHLLELMPVQPSLFDHRPEGGNAEAFSRSDVDGEVLQGGAWKLACREKGLYERRMIAVHNCERLERGHLVKVVPNVS